ncbi:MAG: hypothetical protein GF317_24920 [Candidatus Lokiarchaeota archaeon]|nr:hypothetical protein [Candidatus Lokiarchaeota archaeon]MBD3202602.1 hypothetical protein [Candidatus Lokiarchaeota archaeon]
MNGIVIYFSLLGNNEQLAQTLAQQKSYEIREFSPGSLLRVFQYFLGKKKLRQKAKILNEEIEQYEKVIICGPIWGGTLAPALEILLKKLDLKTKKLRLYLTFTESYEGLEKSLDEINKSNHLNIQEIEYIKITNENKTY